MQGQIQGGGGLGDSTSPLIPLFLFKLACKVVWPSLTQQHWHEQMANGSKVEQYCMFTLCSWANIFWGVGGRNVPIMFLDICWSNFQGSHWWAHIYISISHLALRIQYWRYIVVMLRKLHALWCLKKGKKYIFTLTVCVQTKTVCIIIIIHSLTPLWPLRSTPRELLSPPLRTRSLGSPYPLHAPSSKN